MKPPFHNMRIDPRPVSRRAARAGFTLLELLLTSILSTVLLAGLWSLFNTYMQLFETGQAKTEQSQLVRALAQQLAEDLRSVAVAPPAPSPRNGDIADPSGSAGSPPLIASSPVANTPSSTFGAATSDMSGIANAATRSTESTSLPHFGLVGTSHALKLEVLQTVTPDAMIEDLTESDDTDRDAHTPTVPELRTILYTFEEPREARETDRKAPPGLVRVELDWRKFVDRATRSHRAEDSGLSGADSQLAATIESMGLTSSDGLQSLPANSSVHVPEVLHCAFRYFDGRDWSDEWDTRLKGSLPAAVEVTLQLNPPAERWKPRASKNAKGTTEGNGVVAARQGVRNASKIAADAGAMPVEIQRPVYRQVIALPAVRNAEQGKTFAGRGVSRPSVSGFRSPERRANR